MDNWERFLHDRESLPLLIQIALIHYQFEAIHPFLDGNGRLGRLLIILFLHERKILSQPLLYLSASFEHHREEYYRRLLAVSRDGDWEGWLRFFLEGVITQSRHATELSRRILDLREKYRQRLLEKRAKTFSLEIIEMIFTKPYLTVQTVSRTLHISYNTALRAVSQLGELDILEEITGQQRHRVYVARELLQLIAENEPIYRPKDSK